MKKYTYVTESGIIVEDDTAFAEERIEALEELERCFHKPHLQGKRRTLIDAWKHNFQINKENLGRFLKGEVFKGEDGGIYV